MKKLILTTWENEMAELSYGKTELFLGNTWDFHAGCFGKDFGSIKVDGRKVSLDFTNEWNSSIKGPVAVSEMFAARMGLSLVRVKNKTSWEG